MERNISRVNTVRTKSLANREINVIDMEKRLAKEFINGRNINFNSYTIQSSSSNSSFESSFVYPTEDRSSSSLSTENLFRKPAVFEYH